MFKVYVVEWEKMADFHIFCSLLQLQLGPLPSPPQRVARAFPGGPPESQIEDKNEECLRKNKKRNDEKLRKNEEMELLPTRDCEAGYAPAPLQLKMVVVNRACEYLT